MNDIERQMSSHLSVLFSQLSVPKETVPREEAFELHLSFPWESAQLRWFLMALCSRAPVQRRNQPFETLVVQADVDQYLPVGTDSPREPVWHPVMDPQLTTAIEQRMSSQLSFLFSQWSVPKEPVPREEAFEPLQLPIPMEQQLSIPEPPDLNWLSMAQLWSAPRETTRLEPPDLKWPQLSAPMEPPELSWLPLAAELPDAVELPTAIAHWVSTPREPPPDLKQFHIATELRWAPIITELPIQLSVPKETLTSNLLTPVTLKLIQPRESLLSPLLSRQSTLLVHVRKVLYEGFVWQPQ